MNYHETRTRSILKAIVWRLLVIISDSIVIYLLTRRADITAALVTITNLTSTLLYYGHERVWNSIRWGRQKRK